MRPDRERPVRKRIKNVWEKLTRRETGKKQKTEGTNIAEATRNAQLDNVLTSYTRDHAYWSTVDRSRIFYKLKLQTDFLDPLLINGDLSTVEDYVRHSVMIRRVNPRIAEQDALHIELNMRDQTLNHHYYPPGSRVLRSPDWEEGPLPEEAKALLNQAWPDIEF